MRQQVHSFCGVLGVIIAKCDSDTTKMENEPKNERVIFDPQKVSALIREEYARGHQPASLVLGQQEVASYRHFLRGPHDAAMREDYFYGLEVVEDSAATRMALVGDKGAWEG